MAKKKGKKKSPNTSPDEEEELVDYGGRNSDNDGAAESGEEAAETGDEDDEADEVDNPFPSPPARAAARDDMSVASEEPALAEMSPADLVNLLFKEEMAAAVIASREGRAFELSPSSAAIAASLVSEPNLNPSPSPDLPRPEQAARGKSTRIVVGNDSAAPARSSGGNNRNRGSGSGRDDARASGNHNSNARASGRGNRGGNRSRGRAFDICTFSGCRSRESHPLEDCWAKKRADEEAAKKKTTKPSPKRSRSASHKRSGSDSE